MNRIRWKSVLLCRLPSHLLAHGLLYYSLRLSDHCLLILLVLCDKILTKCGPITGISFLFGCSNSTENDAHYKNDMGEDQDDNPPLNIQR